RVDVETDAGGPLLAVAAPPAGDVERHRHQVPDVQELHVRALLHHLPGDLVPQHQAGRCGGAAAHHVLVAAADVGGDHFEDHAVVHLPADVGRVDSWAVPEHELRHVQVDDLDLARALVDDAPVLGHCCPSSAARRPPGSRPLPPTYNGRRSVSTP